MADDDDLLGQMLFQQEVAYPGGLDTGQRGSSTLARRNFQYCANLITSDIASGQ
jgi:hypothetical protein